MPTTQSLDDTRCPAGHFESWSAGIDAAVGWPARRIGRWMLWIGSGAIPVGMFLSPPWVISGLLVALVGAILSRPPVHRLAVSWIGLAFAAWVMLTVLLAMRRGQPGAGSLPGLAYGWLAVPMAAAAAIDPRWRYWAFRAMVAAGALSGVIALLQFSIGFSTSGILGIDPHGPRWFQARGLTSLNLGFGFVASLLAVTAAGSSTTWGCGAAWTWAGRTAGLLGMGLSGSRGAILGYAAGIGTTLGLRSRRWLLIGTTIGVLAGTALVAKLYVTDPRRFHNLANGEDLRWGIWGATCHLIAEYPITGVGERRAYRYAFNEAFDETYADAEVKPRNKYANRQGCPHAHNWPLALASEHGLPAPLLHFILVGAVVFAAWRRRHDGNGGWRMAAGVCAVGLIGGSFEPLPVQSVTGLGFHACLGIGLGIAYGRIRSAGVPVPASAPALAPAQA